ncbi:hypothetical protein [Dyella nitratireducens]|uniref:hypothetical protein n=1 Tax=Dyella nitratireducens TaxID=1849580 RepID=UPI001663FA96|nr:hypothetical protein [Dyella nitratireducens]
MKPSTSANLALLLIIAGWILAGHGYSVSIEDFGSGTPAAWRDAYYARATLMMVIGVASIGASLWFAGFAFKDARRRALAATILALLPFAVLVACFAWGNF